MHKVWLWNAQLNNRLVYYQGRFLYAKLNPKINIFILGVVFIIANNINQNLKVERTTIGEIKIGEM
jgi:hypothetical protein